MNLLWIAIALVVSAGLLVGLYKFLGKIGLYVFGLYAMTIANFCLVNTGGALNMGDYPIYFAGIMGVLFFGAFFLLIAKYGTKTGFKFSLTMASAFLVFVVINNLLDFVQGTEIYIMDIIRTSGTLFISYLFEMMIGIVLYDLIKTTKLDKFWNCLICFGIIVLLNTIIFSLIFKSGTFTFAEVATMFGTMLYQVAIVFCLVVLLLYWISTFKPATVQYIEEKENKTTPQQIETKNNSAKSVSTKKTTTKNVTEKKSKKPTKTAPKKSTKKK